MSTTYNKTYRVKLHNDLANYPLLKMRVPTLFASNRDIKETLRALHFKRGNNFLALFSMNDIESTFPKPPDYYKDFGTISHPSSL